MQGTQAFTLLFTPDEDEVSPMLNPDQKEGADSVNLLLNEALSAEMFCIHHSLVVMEGPNEKGCNIHKISFSTMGKTLTCPCNIGCATLSPLGWILQKPEKLGKMLPLLLVWMTNVLLRIVRPILD